LLLDLARKLFPVALDAIPIHQQTSVVAAAIAPPANQRN
jgi:hypothetical protein